jgi:carboxyl-terminal processing protease
MLACLIGAVGWVMQAHSGPQYRPSAGQVAFNYSLQTPDATPGQSGSGQGGKLAATPDDANIASFTAQLLSHSDYLHKPLDAEMSGVIFDQYLDALDRDHVYFLKSDIDEFAPVRPQLGEMLMKRGDTSPATRIFSRLLERVGQQVTYVTGLLKTDTFDFTGNDTYNIDRKTAPRPTDLEEARKTWREALRYDYLQLKLNKQKPEEIVKTLTQRYVRLQKSLQELDHDDVLEIYLNAVAHSYDPHSDYLGKSALEQFNTQMRLSLVGIGASLVTSVDGYAQIAELIPGGPAIKSNQFKVGDKISAVAQGDQKFVDVVDMKLDRVVDMIRGKKGTVVRLTVIPADAPDTSTHKVIALVRDEVKLSEQAAKAEVIDIPAGNGKNVRMGVIDLPSFYADTDTHSGNPKSTTTDVARLLKKLEAVKVDGVILDLRRNPGGSLEEVINLTGLFIKHGPVVQVKDPKGDVTPYETPDPPFVYTGPLIVMTNKMSASASEILAGALQDYGRAVIVGDTSTFGKGTVQTLIPLAQVMKRNNVSINSDPGDLKLTIQKFYRPSGSSTQLNGVASDIVLPSLTDVIKELGEKSLDHPLPWDTVPTASFEPSRHLELILPELKKRSEERVAKDQDFIYLQQQIDQVKKLQAETTVVLNEQQRLTEKKEAEARAAVRRKDLLARTAPNQTVYQLTLQNIDKPGLPAPTPWKVLTLPKPTLPVPGEDPTEAANNAPVPNIDPTLDETERIMIDLIALSDPHVARGN